MVAYVSQDHVCTPSTQHFVEGASREEKFSAFPTIADIIEFASSVQLISSVVYVVLLIYSIVIFQFGFSAASL